MKICVTLGWFVLAAFQLSVVAQPCQEKYYMVLYGTETPWILSESHTWATFLRTELSGSQDKLVSVDTVSWMQATLHVRSFALRPETSVNLTLDETLRWVGVDRRPRFLLGTV